MPINATKNTKPQSINLLPQDEFQTSVFGRLLKWALSSFRVMVIVTELIVMSAFLSRFWLDAKNSDLNESIDVSKAQVLAYKTIEDQFRLYQQKLSLTKALYSENKNSKLVSDIVNIMPQEVILSSFQKNDSDVQIKALALTERSIAQFLVNLESIKSISEISLAQVASSVDNSFATTFTINAKLNNQTGGKE